jgi:nicotinate-nucleotide adenylyltransferase
VRAGLLGGTFDPIHLGHLRAAENARQSLGLERVLFMPAGSPPHRAGPRVAFPDRFTMAALATATHPSFDCSDLEARLEGPSYTVNTLNALREQWPGVRFTLILGTDAYAEIGSWHRLPEVLELASLAVVARPGTPLPAGGPAATPVSSSELPISSSFIRSELQEGRSVRYLVPDAVADYIEKKGLYR